jgi:glucokinase
MNKDKTLGILGPGTGLGNSILFTTPFRHRKRQYVLGSEGGHTDVPYIDEEVLEYVQYFEKNIQV